MNLRVVEVRAVEAQLTGDPGFILGRGVILTQVYNNVIKRWKIFMYFYVLFYRLSNLFHLGYI